MINEDLPSISQATGDYFAKDKFERYTVRGLFFSEIISCSPVSYTHLFRPRNPWDFSQQTKRNS